MDIRPRHSSRGPRFKSRVPGGWSPTRTLHSFWGNVRLAGYSSEMPIPSTDFVASNNRSNANQTTERLSMRTARPAARPPRPFFELRAQPFDMLPPCLIFLDGDGPADPLVARERRYVFPSRQCLRVGRERLSEISRKVMYDSSGDLNGCHRAISQAKGSSI